MDTDKINYLYIIPPYILNTNLGSILKKKLEKKSKEFSLLNVVFINSKNYYKITSVNTKKFSQNKYLNKIIKEKFIYKLSLLGVLGDNQTEFFIENEEITHDLFLIFKQNFLNDLDLNFKKNDVQNQKYINESSFLYELTSSSVGEIYFDNSYFNYNYPDEFAKYLSYPLKELIKLVDYYEKCSVHSLSGFLKFDDGTFFDYSLPFTWVPLLPNCYLSCLEKKLILNSENLNGSSKILLSTKKKIKSNEIEELNNDFFLKFITNNSFDDSLGIFFYEFKISQIFTESSKCPHSLSMEKNLDIFSNFGFGFIKRFISIEDKTQNSNPINSNFIFEKIDLKFLFDEKLNEKKIFSEIDKKIDLRLILMSNKIKDSFLFNLQNFEFYNSIENSEKNQKTDILNMNQIVSNLKPSSINKLNNDVSKFDFSFVNNSVFEECNSKKHESKVIGCGINFIEKSIFFTLNEKLVRVFQEDELSSYNPLCVDFFLNDLIDGKKNSFYPIIGLDINHIDKACSHFDLKTLVIKLNLGFHDFKFDIISYMKKFRNESDEKNFQYFFEDISSPTSKNLKSNLTFITNYDSSLIIRMIKNFLLYNCHLDTLNSFNDDLKQSPNNDTDILEKNNFSLMKKSHFYNRRLIKTFLYNKEFFVLRNFLLINYSTIFDEIENNDVHFELSLIKFVDLIKTYLQYKKKNDLIHEERVNYYFKKSFEYGIELKKLNMKNNKYIHRIDLLFLFFFYDDDDVKKKYYDTYYVVENLHESLNCLFNKINSQILKSLNMKEISDLNETFESVYKNVDFLVNETLDKNFCLLNLEKDYFDLD